MCGNPKEIKNLENLGVDMKIILKIILKAWVRGMVWTDLILDKGRWGGALL